MTVPTVPDDTDACWPADLSACADWDSYPAEVQANALALAASTLRALTAYSVGGCPITVRPCQRQCFDSALPYAYPYGGSWGWGGTSWTGGSFTPVNFAGRWINVGCGCTTDCSCTVVCEVVLPPPVGFVESVQIDGAEVPATSYRVDNGRRLVWQDPDNDCGWPLCQDMSAPLGDPDTFAVTYLNARPVDGQAAYVCGIMACEFGKSASGGKCRLPAGVTQVVRQGVAYQVGSDRGAIVSRFADGVTGIPEVDAWLKTVNPFHVKQPAGIWYPGMQQGRITTWEST